RRGALFCIWPPVAVAYGTELTLRQRFLCTNGRVEPPPSIRMVAALWGEVIVLHVPTLAIVAVFVTAILGVLLLLAWRREQDSNALLWWGSGYLAGAASFALLSARGVIPDVFS